MPVKRDACCVICGLEGDCPIPHSHVARFTHHEIFRNFAKLANNVFVPFPANATVTSSSSAVNSDLSTIPWPNRP